jgi:hypothetical protein
MAEACVPGAGLLGLLEQLGVESDSLDVLANAEGQICGAQVTPLSPFVNRTQHCLNCCLTATYDIPYHI